ncbi:hypothetical protein HMPREF2678_01945 [Corynebacterium sp. HMSC058E07]|nr:hypothetical protein HMPREF2678_01945 [Corynebacterium sp. HMSC058E07]
MDREKLSAERDSVQNDWCFFSIRFMDGARERLVENDVVEYRLAMNATSTCASESLCPVNDVPQHRCCEKRIIFLNVQGDHRSGGCRVIISFKRHTIGEAATTENFLGVQRIRTKILYIFPSKFPYYRAREVFTNSKS